MVGDGDVIVGVNVDVNVDVNVALDAAIWVLNLPLGKDREEFI